MMVTLDVIKVLLIRANLIDLKPIIIINDCSINKNADMINNFVFFFFNIKHIKMKL